MKKLLLIVLTSLLFTKINSQCSVAVQSVSENFNASSTLPACWTAINGASIQSNQLFLSAGSGQPMAILPKVLNARGVLNFRGWTTGNFGTVQITVGVVSATNTPASFVAIKSFTLNSVTFVNFSANFNTYTGSNQFVAIILSNNTEARFDDFTYQSCISTTVSAIAKNYTVQLNSNGLANISPNNINNGSTSGCGTPSISINTSTFNCSNIGVNTVTLTATDNSGNISTATASVTILPAINNETLSVLQNTICSGKSTTITTGSSVSGISYYLRDDATNNVIVGPVIGTGSPLSFNTGSLVTNTSFNVYAETQTNGYGLDFDGLNDVITTNVTTSATNSLTIEAWIFPRASVYKRIISSYNNNAATSGELLFDTYNATNNGRALRFAVEGAGNTLHQLSTANVLTLNTWNHVAGTFENGVTKIFVNGIEVATSTATFTSIPSCTNKINIGEDPSIGTAEYFNGKIDDIRIWNTSRTPSEIAGNMNNCLVGNELGLMTYFKIYENTGNTITDMISGDVGTMSVGMTPSTAWVAGNVNCGATICNLEMANLITVNIAPNPIISVNSGTICTGNSFIIAPSGASTYTIEGGNAIVTPTANTTYTVVGTNSTGCISSTFAVSNVTVSAIPLPTISVNSGTICAGTSFTITPGGADSYTIQGGSAIKTPTSNASYTVVGTSSLGCVSNTFATSSIVVNALPIINATSSKTLLCVGQTASLTANGATSYTWNTSSTNTVIVISPTVTTTYTVIGTNDNGCENTSTITQNVSTCTGINNITTSNNAMTLFPNPSSSILTIQTIDEIKEVFIFNTLGTLVQTEKANSFSVEQLFSGIYIIQVKTEKGISGIRFIKE